MNHRRPFLATLACVTLSLALLSMAIAASYTVTDLGTLGGTLSVGSGINASGQVTGYGTIDGQTHAFLLTPVPEPSTLVLAALACVAVISWHSRRRTSI